MVISDSAEESSSEQSGEIFARRPRNVRSVSENERSNISFQLKTFARNVAMDT